MSTHSQALNERISALMDGELPAAELDALLAEMALRDSSANPWHLYHVTGDVMRSSALAPQRTDLAFLERLEHRLAQESVASPPVLVAMPSIGKVGAFWNVSANGSWRWLAGATLSVLVGVVSVGIWWSTEPASAPQISQLPTTGVEAVALQADGVMLRDPELDALMAAHQQLGGHSAWQMPSGFLRNATFERPTR
ncbi:sigma-E factor negative regulatory protein [Rhodoferax sp.]|uniref:sigma-E factor negative regulatory protein n=1 Tax=Rhodoferax sp. TaxID=50421 RepID=UPI002ACDE996|nr:sigma-E factor negative regulatory protein [Rhodoferax sp.]MDZ7921724.1 sigma-E factor negative regulatory protein [Rhodoferax sp.]